jgi:hypothetical protein
MVMAPAFPNRREVRSSPPAFSPPPKIQARHVFLNGPTPDGWIIADPLPVSFEQDDDGTYLVSDDIFLVYGSGDSLGEAIEDYLGSLFELYRLTETGVKNNTADQPLWERLQAYLRIP